MSRADEAQGLISALAQRAAVSDDTAAFGAYALPSRMESLRRFAQTLGSGALARRGCSMIRRVVSLGRRGPFDVEPFPGQAARLYPAENLSDKRVFAGVQFFDAAERRALGQAVRNAGDPVYFVDAGANAGLYTLAVRSEAKDKALKVLAIEPDPENVRRLTFNIVASGATEEVVIAEVALSDREDIAMLSASHANRGELRLAECGTRVALRPLIAVLDWAGFPRIDAMKIDVEGMECQILRHFFAHAGRDRWPSIVIIEAQRGETTDAVDLLLGHGYRIDERTRMNVVLTLPAGAARAEENRYAGSEHGQA